MTISTWEYETNFKIANACDGELEALRTWAVSSELTISQFITVGSLIKTLVIDKHGRDPEQEA